MKGQSLRPYCGLKSDYFPHLLWVRLWSFHFCPDKHSIWFPPCMDTRCIKYMSETVRETMRKNMSSFRALFNSPSEQYNPLRNKMRFILSWPQREFHHSVTAKMPTRSMVHETASFYWHGIQSVPPGYMSLVVQWGLPITALPAFYHPIPFYTPPAHHHFHPSINTIRPVKKGTITCILPLFFLIDYAEYCAVPPRAFWILLELARCQETFPHPSHSWPLTSQCARPLIPQIQGQGWFFWHS